MTGSGATDGAVEKNGKKNKDEEGKNNEAEATGAAAAAAAVAAAGSDLNAGGDGARGPRRMSRYQKRKLNMSNNEFEGLAPIVVDILMRRPLPALDEDAVIIKRKKSTVSSSMWGSQQNARSKKPHRPTPAPKRRHKFLHSHNKNSSFAAAKRKKAEELRAKAKLKHPSMQ